MPPRIDLPPRACMNPRCGTMISRYWPDGRRIVPARYALRRFCSARCRGAVKRKPFGFPHTAGRKAKGCRLCGTPMYRKRFPNGQFESAANYTRRRFCALGCLAAWYENRGDRRALGVRSRLRNIAERAAI